MNKDTLWEAMAHLEPELIEEADRQPRRRMSVGKVLVIAAAACLVLAAGVLAAESIFGFQILEMRNDGEINSYELLATGAGEFPISQFGQTVQDYIVNGMPVLEETEPESSGQGIEASVVSLDVPTFASWEEAAEFMGKDIPLVPENQVLAGGSCQEAKIYVNRNVVSLYTVYALEGHTVFLSAFAKVEGSEGFTVGSSHGAGDLTITPEQAVTGSGTDVLLYVTTGERPACEAYFIQEGIFYNLFLDSGDLALMEEILAAF